MVDVDRELAARMWQDYCDAHPGMLAQDVAVETFGDSPALADELVGFVVDGPKRATAEMVSVFEARGESLPLIGGHWVVCDGSGAPRVVLRTVELRLGPLSSVTEQFAWDEGEYDRSLETWLDGHRRYFRRSCEELGLAFSDDVEVCFERFQVVWPPEHADGAAPALSR